MVKKMIIYLVLYCITVFIILSPFFIEKTDNNYLIYLNIVLYFLYFFLIIKYARFIFLIIISPWNKVISAIRDKRYKNLDFNPKVSVIIPAYNEEVGLLSTVKSILKSKYRNMEIIIVNDGSTDDSHKIMSGYIKNRNLKKNDIDIKYFYKENEGKGVALNYGIKRAIGDIIITIDADCIITPDTVTNFIKPFFDSKVSGVVGNVKIGNTVKVVGMVQYLEFLSSFYAKNAESVLSTIYIMGGAAAAFRADVFKKVGLYNNDNITEDIDMSVRLCDRGMKIVYEENAIVYTEGANDIKGLAKQRLRWKTGWFQTLYNNKHIVFSKNKKHNKILSWFMIPLVYLGNIQLLFELWFIIFLYIYSFLIQDFSLFFTWIGIEVLVISTVIFSDFKNQRKSILFFIPITWLLFYLSIYIEYRSLITMTWNYVKGKKLRWQKWERSGCGVEV